MQVRQGRQEADLADQADSPALARHRVGGSVAAAAVEVFAAGASSVALPVGRPCCPQIKQNTPASRCVRGVRAGLFMLPWQP